MQRRPRRKEHLTEEQIRERVNRVMQDWQSYPDFAHLFDALMVANDHLDNQDFAKLYTERTGRRISDNMVSQYRLGETLPSYPFILDVLDNGLLKLDPQQTRPADSDRLAGAQRVALFSSAGLIEVTPQSIRQWNSEVLEGHRRLIESRPHGPRPQWGDLMQKLISFHTQGQRLSREGVLNASPHREQAGGRLDLHRIPYLLTNRCPPTSEERLALAQALGLDQAQIRYLEEGIEAGSIPVCAQARSTAFAARLTDLLAKLRVHGYSQRQIAAHSADPVTGEQPFCQVTLSVWRLGKTEPTIPSLRALAQILDRCRDKDGGRLVSPEEIDDLLAAAGTSRHALEATTHEVIARATDATRITDLLRDIRNAEDLSVALPSVTVMDHGPNARAYRLPRIATLTAWENDDSASPRGPQVRELLDRYNILLSHKGRPPLAEAEIAKVVTLAEQYHARRLDHSFTEAIRPTSPSSARRLPSPSFDDRPAR